MGLRRVVQFFFVDFDPIDTNKVLNILEYLRKKT